jgi:hypothetical protein
MEYPTEFPEFFIAHRAGGAIYKNFNHSQLIFEVKRLKVWPDCIGPWASHGPLLFSERVVASAQESGVSGLIARRAKLEFLKAKTQNPTDPPWDYYAIEVSGEMDFAIEVFERIESKGAILGYKRRYVTKNCDDPRLRYCAQGFFNYKRFLPRKDAWDGCDCFRGQAMGFLFGAFGCTRRFLELAHENRWTNIAFGLLDSLDGGNVDHLTRSWPPESWTPPDNRLIL